MVYSLLAPSNTLYLMSSVYMLLGTVNVTSLEVSLSTPALFANNSHYNIQSTVVGLTPSLYLVLYSDSLHSGGPYGKLYVMVASVVTTGSSTSVSLSNATSLEGSKLAYVFEATRIDDFTAIVAYANGNTGYGITAQIITITSEYQYIPDTTYYYIDDGDNGYYEYLVQFGSTLDFTTVSMKERYFWPIY